VRLGAGTIAAHPTASAPLTGPKPATPATRDANAAAAAALPVDADDHEEAQRGFVGRQESLVIRDDAGSVVWDMDAYGFLTGSEAGPAPDTVHPGLWRRARLNALHGLFEVTTGVFQVRGYDISNMTVLEGERGVIVVDPLISAECAAAGLELYRAHRGSRPVVAVIYTHSHVDHFGGVAGVLDAGMVERGDVSVWAPAGFTDHAVSENVLAGTAMSRRSAYMFAPGLPRGPRGQVDSGIGKTTSRGTVTVIPPTEHVTRTGQEEVIDGVRLVFQLTPDTEAPAEMNFHLADRRALCVAENATHTQHNVLTPRGALVRDALRWSKCLDETIALFGDGTDVLFCQHHWPRWGRERIREHLVRHRDLYRFIHDQTLRLANRGATPAEIAASLELPPTLARTWSTRGFYGTLGFNARAVYQRYLGFFDGNPAHLEPLPPEEAGRRYVALAGGAEAVLAAGEAAFEHGDYRWAAELASHVVFADPANRRARDLEADALEQLGYQAQSAVWRNHYLVGAAELRTGVQGGAAELSRAAGLVRSLTVEQLFDAMATRLNGERAAETRLVVNWDFTDVDEQWVLTVENAALSTRSGRLDPDAGATVTLTRAAMDAVTLGESTLERELGAGSIAISGDAATLVIFFGLLDDLEPGFEIVAP
jgi:alkyl sulfatase BDS1-like metallo-beta-lactamase superfamily hydrolase